MNTVGPYGPSGGERVNICLTVRMKYNNKAENFESLEMKRKHKFYAQRSFRYEFWTQNLQPFIKVLKYIKWVDVLTLTRNWELIETYSAYPFRHLQ